MAGGRRQRDWSLIRRLGWGAMGSVRAVFSLALEWLHKPRYSSVLCLADPPGLVLDLLVQPSLL
jgi:hypothetical protein